MSDHHVILIVDDDKLILNTLKQQFESWSMDALTAATPDETRNQLENATPDLIILDLLLTQSDGSAGILDYLQSEPRLKRVPVIVLTNLDKPELKEMLLSKGIVKEYLTKGSLDLDELHRKVWGYLTPQEAE